jgi:uracil-DNA glycosylase family 4
MPATKIKRCQFRLLRQNLKAKIAPVRLPIASSSPEKSAAFAELQKRALACVKCPHLASSRKNVVFGVGSIDAQLMFVGEAPGADEDEQGEPFVGRAGQLLTKIIQATGLSRADVYIANILKCRPDTPGQSAGNRKPTPDEMATCIPYLHEQIDLIRPKVIVALGATAVEGLLGKTVGHHEAARQLADVSRHAAHADVSSGVSVAQPGDEREAQSLGRYAVRDGKTRNARQRETAELFFEGVKLFRQD